jgi:hypothetical protein
LLIYSLMSYVKLFEEFTSGESRQKFYRGDDRIRINFGKSYHNNTIGSYFTTDKIYAETYDRFITEAYINISNPYYVDHINKITDWDFDVDELVAAGYNGVMFTDYKDNQTLAYVFYNDQVEVIRQYENN